jgi:enoyl-CoA hydratase/carnithine racemase
MSATITSGFIRFNANCVVRRGCGPRSGGRRTIASVGDVRYEVDGPIARVTIDRDARRNALSYPVMRDLRAAFERADDDAAVRVVVLTGAGDRAFSAGADLVGDGAAGSIADTGDHAARHDDRALLADLFRTMWRVGVPSIARVRGYALAGGFGLALACDLVVAADDAVFGTPELDVGLWPYMITVPMVRSMTPKAALELILTGRRVDAEEALRLGFVNRVVPAAALDAEVDRLAQTIASKAPVALRWGRQAFQRVLDLDADDALAYLQAMLTVTSGTDDAAEGLTAFGEKRAPRWSGT